MSWSASLERVRSFRQSKTQAVHTDFAAEFRVELSSWHEPIAAYNAFLQSPRTPGQPVTEETKTLILETRAALRFGLIALSCEDPAMRSYYVQRHKL